MREYVVQHGDTLASIAKKILGQASRWPEIANLNRKLNPNFIFVGEKLILPDARSCTQSLSPQDMTVRLTGQNGWAPQIPANMALARGFLFVVFEQLPEIGSGKIIRKVKVIPRDFSLKPPNPLGKLSLAEHVLDLKHYDSQLLSASNRPFGAPSMYIDAHPLILDVAKIQRAGGKIYSVSEIVRDLERFAAQDPKLRIQIDKLIWTIRNIEGEVVIEGGTPPGSARRPSMVHNAYIRSAEDLWVEFQAGRLTREQLRQELANLEKSYSQSRILGRVGRVLTVVGVVISAAEVTQAMQRSINQNSFRPLGAEAVRQVGGWGGAFAGAKIGFGCGALFGIETGPGAIVTGALGAIIFGAVGYFKADQIADQISPN
jgi:hypothetical protein